MTRIRCCVLGAALAAALAATSAVAQLPLVPRALGLGGAYIGLARGQESLFLNPANLGLADGPRWSVAFPQVTVGGTLRGQTISDVRDLIGYDDLNQQERDELLAGIPQDGIALEGDVRAPFAAFQSGNFAVGVAYSVTGEHGVSRDVVELFVDGFDPSRRDYTVSGTDGRRASYLDFAAGYGRSVGPLSLGATGHYYLGRALSRTRAFDPSYTDIIIDRDIRVEYVGVASEGGSGFGLDLGAALQPAPGVTLSASVANVLSSFSWDEELVGRSVTLNRDNFRSDFELVYSDYKRSDRSLGATPTGRFAEVAEGIFDNAEPPTTLRVGAGWSLPSGTGLSAAYHTNLSEGTLAGRWESLAAVGVQQRILFFTARVGASTNLEDGSLLGGGITLGPVDVGVAKLSGEGSDGTEREGWIASFGLSARPRR